MKKAKSRKLKRDMEKDMEQALIDAGIIISASERVEDSTKMPFSMFFSKEEINAIMAAEV